MIYKKINWIFHIDFDSYFASAIKSVIPELKDKEVSIARSDATNSISVALSQELKKKGAKVGMRINELEKISNKFHVWQPNHDFFNMLSKEIFDFIHQTYKLVYEVYSVDEAYFDASNAVNNANEAIELATLIQKNIKEKFNIPLTVGIGHSKFIAKMTTNLAKPFGIKYTSNSDIKKNFYDLEISEFFGLGRGSYEKLYAAGIYKIGDLERWNERRKEFKKIVGFESEHIFNNLYGPGEIEIQTEIEDFKNIGHEISFEMYYLSDVYDIKEHIKEQLKKVCIRAQNRNLVGNTISLNLRLLETLKWKRFSRKIKSHTNDFSEIWSQINQMFDIVYDGSVLKGVGVRLQNLKNADLLKSQINLFENETRPENDVSRIIDSINFQLNKKSLKTLSQHSKIKDVSSSQHRFLAKDISERKK
ncbi:hypothetical protein [Mycoplasma sp. Ms02]|uniref:Y-family DNA polymerase n=1 Tax=Mycoplasma sp. Ms02 TaxID=353851 RepID=UPI001C8A4468|nr:hypothetical protein [Mycoplasma sp. Ms02]QZE12405.1 hypothetical protein K4L35_00215 [Mycoplasma sp. Ms02]